MATTLKMDRFAAMNLIYSRCETKAFLDSVQRLGLSNIELWTEIPHFYEQDPSLSDAAALRKEIERRGLKLVCFIPEQCTLPYNIASPDRCVRQRSVEYYVRHMRIAAEFGAEKVLLTPGWYPWDKPTRDGWEYSEDSLRRVLPEAQACGVSPVLEILQPCESNLMYDLPTTRRYAERFSEDELNFCIDTVPVCLAGETLADYFRLLGGRLRHVHLIDGTPTGHLVLGDGNQPLRAHLNAMRAYGYEGFITLEFGARAYLTQPEFHMRRGLRFLRGLLDDGEGD